PPYVVEKLETTPVMPMPSASFVVRFGSAADTTSCAVRATGPTVPSVAEPELAAARSALAVLDTSSVIPAFEGMMPIRFPARTRKSASTDFRSTRLASRLKYAVAAGPPMARVVDPSDGRSSNWARRQRAIFQVVPSYVRRTDAEITRRACAAIGASRTAVTVGAS